VERGAGGCEEAGGVGQFIAIVIGQNMERAYFVICFIPVLLVSAFFWSDNYGPGGQTGVGRAIFLAEAITIFCPLISLAGIFVVGYEVRKRASILLPLLAFILAACPGIIFLLIEKRMIP
jgi:hypothetical protein